jgi:4-hydroxyphenylpyruvate dioxygenase-like putative hemolysin
MSEKIKLKNIDHYCVIVDDLEKEVKKLEKVFEVSSIQWDEVKTTAVLKGKNLGDYTLRSVMIQLADNFKLEFLQIAEGKSVEQDWVKKHGKTLHHICFKSDDMEKEAKKYEEKGVKILQEDHGKWIYLDTEDIFGFDIEILPTWWKTG